MEAKTLTVVFTKDDRGTWAKVVGLCELFQGTPQGDDVVAQLHNMGPYADEERAALDLAGDINNVLDENGRIRRVGKDFFLSFSNAADDATKVEDGAPAHILNTLSGGSGRISPSHTVRVRVPAAKPISALV